jgi:hypothetical protein
VFSRYSDAKAGEIPGSGFATGSAFMYSRVSHCLGWGVAFFDDRVSSADVVGRVIADDCENEIHDAVLSDVVRNGHSEEEVEAVARRVIASDVTVKRAIGMILASRAASRAGP